MASKKEVKKYYDEYIKEQFEIGVNDRIFLLYQKLLEEGLNPLSNVIELGCGIGVVTHLISKTVTEGKVESIDISPESIEFAKSKIRNKNISFYSGDVTEYQPKLKQADFITLFDVIEHIPIELHEKLFLNVSNMMHAESKLLINIPSPASIKWDRENDPKALQIIDQEIPISVIAQNCDKAGLELIFFESYSIWKEDDYHFMIIRKKKDFTNIDLSTKRTFKEKLIKKIWREKIKKFYSYK